MEHDETKHSTVMIAVDEDADRTRATAHLPWRSTTLVGMGIARMDAGDAHAVELRDEVAVARALSNLANQLFATSMSEIDGAAVWRPPLAAFQRR
ncbi:dsRBD fold-containing protein [Mycolicibacterium vinylchloridicum]|uniref:dsRBD fold-containing protein n=1 Tax=Mycolicibacterium vinylchloridicum TaxID=2736928 RepID=UPI0015C899C5|nr:dsRBD fold-containing protein [Mycolicibacterium vinylchloridicum]